MATEKLNYSDGIENRYLEVVVIFNLQFENPIEFIFEKPLKTQ